MFNLNSIIMLLLCLTSCASASWVRVDVAENERPIRLCSPEIDGEEKAYKGFCYKVKYVKKRTLRSDLYKVEELFWPFTDTDIVKKFINEDRVLVPR